jgi:hypothetical protein
MKVKITGYKTWYQSKLLDYYMRWKYGEDYYRMKYVLRHETKPFELFLEKLDDKLQYLLNLTINKLTPEQKVKVKIHNYDVWSLDHTLAHIIHPALVKLKDCKQGAPSVPNEFVPDHLKATDEELRLYKEEGLTDDKFFERFDYVLDEMIYAFSTKLDDNYEDQFYNGEHLDYEACKADAERVEQGFRLFGIFYNSLWT